MNRPLLQRFRTRLLILVALGLILSAAIIDKKVLPSWQHWQAVRSAEADRMAGTDPIAELASARARLADLDGSMGATAIHGWQPVLDYLSAHGEHAGVQLAAIDAEHSTATKGLTVRTLPLSLHGRTDQLINAIAALESDAPHVHIASVDLHASAASYRVPRHLTATLYLQTLEP